MKPPTKCTCHVHATADYSKYSRNAELLRRVRRDSLINVAKLRKTLETETDPKERAWLHAVVICTEWGAWIDLLILREIKTGKPMEATN